MYNIYGLPKKLRAACLLFNPDSGAVTGSTNTPKGIIVRFDLVAA